MLQLSRRNFVGWIGAILAAVGVRRSAAAAEEPPSPDAPQPDALDAALLRALTEAVLPAELGRNGIDSASRDFARWLRGYRGGAELVHGYGTGKLSVTPESPEGRWRRQLTALDEAARAGGGKGFASTALEERRRLVRAALAGETLASFPEPAGAAHVAIGLMAWYFASPAATDLCYGAAIGRYQCRPLALNPNEPVALGRASAPRGLHQEGGR